MSGLLDPDPDQILLRRHLQLTADAEKTVEAYFEAGRDLDEARSRYEAAQRTAVEVCVGQTCRCATRQNCSVCRSSVCNSW